MHHKYTGYERHVSQRTIVFIALGSAGNRRPFVAAALACRAAGFSVRCLTTPPWQQWLQQLGIPVTLLSAQAAAMLSQGADYPDIPESAVAVGRLGRLRLWYGGFAHRTTVATELARHFADAAAVVASVGLPALRRVLADWDIPVIWVSRAGIPADTSLVHAPVLGISAPTLYPAVMPQVPLHRVIGEWLLPESDGLPAPLERFVRVNRPFVVMLHGAYHSAESRAVTTLAVSCAHDLGLRALVVWPEDDDTLASDEQTFVWNHSVSQQRVLAAAAAVIHPGGAGTTHRVVRAGVPSVPVALCASDQVWAEHSLRVQLTPAFLTAQRLSRTALSDALAHCVTDVSYRYRARALATQMASDHGLEQLAAVLRPYTGTA